MTGGTERGSEGDEERPLGHQAVEAQLQRALATDKVQRVLGAMKQAGCAVLPGAFFKVLSCGALNAVGGYSQSQGVILCHDQLRTNAQVASTALHELLHAYDDCRAGERGLDWSDLHAHACAEVRAAALSGDCDLEQELWRGQVELTRPASWLNVHARCVARRAALSVALNPACASAAEAARAVSAVMARCMADRRPIHEQPAEQH